MRARCRRGDSAQSTVLEFRANRSGDRVLARRGGEPSGVNLVKAVIKLISYLEDARMYRAARESGPAASRSFSL